MFRLAAHPFVDHILSRPLEKTRHVAFRRGLATSQATVCADTQTDGEVDHRVQALASHHVHRFARRMPDSE
jgi:hypothetical protein